MSRCRLPKAFLSGPQCLNDAPQKGPGFCFGSDLGMFFAECARAAFNEIFGIDAANDISDFRATFEQVVIVG